MGKLIVIEGVDGSGKGTQTAMLYDKLLAKGINVRKVSFPCYDSPASQPVKMYLAGEFGKSANDVNAYAASIIYAVDRFASFKSDWGSFYEDGGIILADRYTTSNAVHQCSKLPCENWGEYLTWLFETEYGKIAIPKPDIVIYLKVDGDVSQKLLTSRYNGNESKKDIHERDLQYLQKSRTAAAYCAEKCGWKIIECCENGEMRSIEDINNDIVAIINIVLKG